jgi:hypothetical protein
MRWQIALYVGIGGFLIQFLHTVYSWRTFHNKKVILFELISGFNRGDDPDEPPEWRHLFKPSKLESSQSLPDNLPDRVDGLVLKLGLDSTNITYCFLASLIYGILISFPLLTLLPEVSSLGPLSFVVYSIAFGLLVAVSQLAVGISIANIILEVALFAFAFLIPLSSTELFSDFAVNTLVTVVITVSLTGLVEWINSEARKDRIEYGDPPNKPDQVLGVFYVGVSYAFVLFGFLTLMALYGGL